MNPKKFFVGRAVGLLVVLVLAGVGYVVMNPQVLQVVGINFAPKDEGEPNIAWQFKDAEEVDAIPHTEVSVIVNGKTHTIGKFQGSCQEIGATGGIDGKGLLAGELSAAQCWYAGGGDEIGVFAIESGGVEVMVGSLSEGADGAGMFRGDFNIRTDIQL